jgi:hypothetical protein
MRWAAPVELWRPQPARCIPSLRIGPFPATKITALAGQRAKHVSYAGLALREQLRQRGSAPPHQLGVVSFVG